MKCERSTTLVSTQLCQTIYPHHDLRVTNFLPPPFLSTYHPMDCSLFRWVFLGPSFQGPRIHSLLPPLLYHSSAVAILFNPGGRAR